MKHTPNIGGSGEGVDGKREAVRDTMLLHATLRHLGEGTEHTARVRNLSAGGMMVEIGNPFRHGDRLTVELRGVGEVNGRVAWVEGGRIGVALDEPIDPRLARRPLPQGASTHAITKALKKAVGDEDADADADEANSE